MDIEKIKKIAKEEEKNIVSFLREIISIESKSGNEEKAANRILSEMENVGMDEVYIDDVGSVIGRIGNERKKILYDSHIDTVGVSSSWKFDPYEGKVENGRVYGLGASDNKGGMASMVYGAKIINKARIEFDGTLYIAGVVQEEDCEGFAISKIIDKIKPDYVLLGECTSLNVNIGHRGRAEIKVVTKGKACHASTPNRGENAIYNMLPIIEKIKKIRFKRHKFLGRGTIAVTKIESSSPSLNAIPDECKIYLDRRLTFGETKESCIKELKEIADKARVEVLRYNSTSYKGKLADLEKYFPTWLMEQKHEFVQKAVETGRLILGKKPKIGKWDFSTDGIYTMGIARIPTIGFGPGEEKYAHTNEDNVMINELVNASAFYALFPNILLGGDKK